MALGACFTDLDGTLLRDDGTVSQGNRQALERLGQAQILRVAATGRSLHSVKKVLTPDFPIDVVIFSSGAGIWDWHAQELLEAYHFSATEVPPIVAYLQEANFDFMVHGQVPDNHYFCSHQGEKVNPDFQARLQLYAGMATSLCQGVPEQVSQFLVIEPPSTTAQVFTQLQGAFPQYSIIRATSPLDGASGWLEIFPAEVSKSQSAARVNQRYQIPWHQVMAIGNDFNDVGLLQWSPYAYLVANAPPVLQGSFPSVASNEQDGFAAAVKDWLSQLKG